MKQNLASVPVLGGGLRHQHADTHTLEPKVPPLYLPHPQSLQLVCGRWWFFGTSASDPAGISNRTHNQANFFFAVEETSKMIDCWSSLWYHVGLLYTTDLKAPSTLAFTVHYEMITG